ncbi:hypothetical protein [uncultured Microbacterium sp.]|uniref:hypothetical protein n=1 Tax=uncultured Microbacterium sp. TaxID=191216 RepID=UPI0035CB65C9
MLPSAPLPGFLATTGEVRTANPLIDGVHAATYGDVRLSQWGLAAPDSAENPVLIASRVVRRATGQVRSGEVARQMRVDARSLRDMLPPFAAVAAGTTGVQMVADSMGFGQLFHTDAGHSGASAMSSSALMIGRVAGLGLDETAVGVQSLLGWQLGQRTLFAGLSKLAPGAVASLDAHGVSILEDSQAAASAITRRAAVVAAATLLRTALEALLDDHPDAVLQLTGGMDSRLLLSAIPEARRRGLRAMTLDVEGKGDVAIARQLSRRYGVRHDVRGLLEVGATTPEQAWALCRAEASRLDAMSDPVALAAQRIAERAFDQGVRISGLGGEIARGFYYVGRVADRSYTRADAARLASWRMFVNDAVEPGLLREEFGAWARERAIDEVHAALLAGGPEWFRATDELYLRHRMQRWAGATDGAVANDRVVINPMLDHGFLALAARLRPRDKVGSRFLAELQMELDPELGRVPLDGRPAPAAYAHPSAWQPLTQAIGTGQRVARKALQRVRRGNRPPAGGEVMAAKVVEHWRAEPRIVAELASVPFVREEWVTGMLSGQINPRPSSVAFVTNLLVTTGADE